MLFVCFFFFPGAQNYLRNGTRDFCFFVKAAGAWSRLKAEKGVIFNMVELKLAKKESTTVSSFRFLIGGAPDVVTPLSRARRGFLRGKKSAVCLCSPTPVTCAFNKAEVSLMLGYETASHHFLLQTPQPVQTSSER